MDWHSGWHMSWMTARWVMEVVLLVAFAWILAARAAAFQAAAHPEGAPEAIIRRRYARGEIGETEYERRLTELSKHAARSHEFVAPNGGQPARRNIS